MPVATDKEAFDHIRGRLTGDVGGIFAAVQSKAIGHVPFWTLVRCLFPVAESIADLIHHGSSHGTAHALTLLLENELEQVRAGYKKVAATRAIARFVRFRTERASQWIRTMEVASSLTYEGDAVGQAVLFAQDYYETEKRVVKALARFGAALGVPSLPGTVVLPQLPGDP